MENDKNVLAVRKKNWLCKQHQSDTVHGKTRAPHAYTLEVGVSLSRAHITTVRISA